MRCDVNAGVIMLLAETMPATGADRRVVDLDSATIGDPAPGGAAAAVPPVVRQETAALDVPARERAAFVCGYDNASCSCKYPFVSFLVHFHFLRGIHCF
jgi:hypothetical protein